MEPKSAFTFAHVFCSASIFLTSHSAMTASILALSFSTVAFFPIRSEYSACAFSNMESTFLLMRLESASSCELCLASAFCCAATCFADLKSYSPPGWPKLDRSGSIHGFLDSRSRHIASAASFSLMAREQRCSSCLSSTSASATSCSSASRRSPICASLASCACCASLCDLSPPVASSKAALAAVTRASISTSSASPSALRFLVSASASSAAPVWSTSDCSCSRSFCSACCAFSSALADALASFSALAMAALDCLSRSSRLPSKSVSRAASDSRSSLAAESASLAATPAASASASCERSSSRRVERTCASPACSVFWCIASLCALSSRSEASFSCTSACLRHSSRAAEAALSSASAAASCSRPACSPAILTSRHALPLGREPPVTVPCGSYRSPSSVTVLRRSFSHTRRADSLSRHTSDEPNTYSIAGCSSAAHEMRETAATARSPTSLWTCCSCAGEAVVALILLSGMRVTRRCSPPFVSSSMPVFSLSTTTWCSRPPASASRAVALAMSCTRRLDAIVPLTRERSKPGSGSRKRKSAPPPMAAAAASACFASASRFFWAAACAPVSAASAASSKPSSPTLACAAATAFCSESCSLSALSPDFEAAASCFSTSLASFEKVFPRISDCLSAVSCALTSAVASLSWPCRFLTPSPEADAPMPMSASYCSRRDLTLPATAPCAASAAVAASSAFACSFSALAFAASSSLIELAWPSAAEAWPAMASRRCLSEAVALTRSLDASSSFFSSALTASLAPLFFALATSAASLLSEASSALASESVCCSSRWRAKSPACSSSTFLCTCSALWNS
mmetsp:Transcript_7399/g.23286  ORF Transcript_7399/g.23286 Transcript_7399/m.23286 type:complete len:808 (+) Transcript_7399:946-3369(+)